MKATWMNQVWIVLWIVLICERRSATQKSKKHDPAIAHILAFCLLYFRAKKTNHGLLTLLQQWVSFLSDATKRKWTLRGSRIASTLVLRQQKTFCRHPRWRPWGEQNFQARSILFVAVILLSEEVPNKTCPSCIPWQHRENCTYLGQALCWGNPGPQGKEGK